MSQLETICIRGFDWNESVQAAVKTVEILYANQVHMTYLLQMN